MIASTESPAAMTDPDRRMGRTEQLLHEVRRMPLFRQVIPGEAGLGWPLPVRRSGRAYAVLPVFGMPRNKDGRIELFAPFAVLTLDWQSHMPVKYVDLKFETPTGFPDSTANAPIGAFPHPAIESWTVQKYQDARVELLALYDELFDALRTRTTMSRESVQRFGELLRVMAEPSLEPYYRALAPGFCAEFLGPPKQ
jgi:hypothetical protein